MAWGSNAEDMGLFMGMGDPLVGAATGRRRCWLAGPRRPAYGYRYEYGLAHRAQNFSRAPRLWRCFSVGRLVIRVAPDARATPIASSGRIAPTEALSRPAG